MHREGPAKTCTPCAGPAATSATVLAHIWPTHHENVHFYGIPLVDVDGELAQLYTDGYRPLRLAEVATASR